MELLCDKIILTTIVQNGPKVLCPLAFHRLDTEWVKSNTCLQLLEKLLRDEKHGDIADKLSDCDICMKCSRSTSIGSKRGRDSDEIIATTFITDTLADALRLMNCDSLLFYVTPPAPAEPVIIDASARLMRAAAPTATLPGRKQHRRQQGDHDLFNSILDYLRGEGLGWTSAHLPSGTSFIEHITKAFWSLGPQVPCPAQIDIWNCVASLHTCHTDCTHSQLTLLPLCVCRLGGPFMTRRMEGVCNSSLHLSGRHGCHSGRRVGATRLSKRI